jgi:hypothetical protein
MFTLFTSCSSGYISATVLEFTVAAFKKKKRIEFFDTYFKGSSIDYFSVRSHVG